MTAVFSSIPDLQSEPSCVKADAITGVGSADACTGVGSRVGGACKTLFIAHESRMQF